MDKKLIFENAAKIVINKAVLHEDLACARALGGPSNVVRAAMIGLQNSDLFGLILAHLVLARSLGVDPVTNQSVGRKSTEQMEEFCAGVTGFVNFMAECASEMEHKRELDAQKEEIKKQQREGGIIPPSSP